MPCSQNDSRTPSRDLRARPVVAVERQAEILPELRAIGCTPRAELVERPRSASRRDWPPSSASAAEWRRSAPPWRRASCRGGRCSARPRRRRSSGRRGSRPSGRASRSAPRDRRRRCRGRCRSRAGSSGRGRGDRGRCSDSRASARKNIWSSNASALSGQPWLKTTGWPLAPVVVIDLGAVLGRDCSHGAKIWGRRRRSVTR